MLKSWQDSSKYFENQGNILTKKIIFLKNYQ